MIEYLASTDLVARDEKVERERRIALYSQSQTSTTKLGQRIGPVWRPVYCHDLEPERAASRRPDEVIASASFFSPVHAANYFCTNRHNVLRAARLGTRCCRTRFETIPNAPVIRARTGCERRLICIDGDIEFSTLVEAARWAGVPQSTMHKAIKLRWPVGAAHQHFCYGRATARE